MTKKEIIIGYIIGIGLFLMGSYTVVKVMSNYDISFAGGIVQLVGLLMIFFGGFILICLINRN